MSFSQACLRGSCILAHVARGQRAETLSVSERLTQLTAAVSLRKLNEIYLDTVLRLKRSSTLRELDSGEIRKIQMCRVIIRRSKVKVEDRVSNLHLLSELIEPVAHSVLHLLYGAREISDESEIEVLHQTPWLNSGRHAVIVGDQGGGALIVDLSSGGGKHVHVFSALFSKKCWMDIPAKGNLRSKDLDGMTRCVVHSSPVTKLGSSHGTRPCLVTPDTT